VAYIATFDPQSRQGDTVEGSLFYFMRVEWVPPMVIPLFDPRSRRGVARRQDGLGSLNTRKCPTPGVRGYPPGRGAGHDLCATTAGGAPRQARRSPTTRTVMIEGQRNQKSFGMMTLGALPGVPVGDLGGGQPPGRAEVGALGVGDREQAALAVVVEGDAEDLGGPLLAVAD